MLTDKNMCPHCNREWYKKTDERIDGAGNKYYSCECMICHKYFDMPQWWYNHYDRESRYLGNEDKDVAELLINNRKCIFCGGQVVKSDSPKIAKTGKERIVEAEIFHCRNSQCAKMFYVPKSIHDEINNIR